MKRRGRMGQRDLHREGEGWKRGITVLGISGRWRLAGILVLVSVFWLWGCGKQDSSDAYIPLPETVPEADITIETEPETIHIEPETEEETIEDEPEERVEKDGMIRSYLTGEMVPVSQGNRRPLAIMMSNDKEALPQYGINRAGVVYEAQVEGTMNRYMAIMEDYDDLERIGSVRSCRTYYTYFAREFDAIYAHFGQSTFARPYLKNVDNINGIEGVGGNAFFRSSDRKRPHNAYASFAKIQKAIEALGYSQEYDASYEGHYLFARQDRPVELAGDDVMNASRVTPGYPYNQPWFEFDETDGLYHRYQYGSVHKGNEGPITVKNILFQYCPDGFYATTQYRNINVHDDSWGYYVTNGKAEKITWKKDGEFGVTHYYGPDGEEILLNPGKTWVCIMSTADYDKTVIE